MKRLLPILIVLAAGPGCRRAAADIETSTDVEADEVEDTTPGTDATPGTDSEVIGDTGSRSVEEDTGSERGTAVSNDTNQEEADCCLHASIRWGSDCMMDHVDPYFDLPRCGETFESPSDYACVPILPTCENDDQVNSRVINKMLDSEALWAVLQGENTNFGEITIPSLSIRLSFGDDDAYIIWVGTPCTGDSPSCVPIPDVLTELRQLLDIVAQDRESYPLLETPSGQEDGFCTYHYWV